MINLSFLRLKSAVLLDVLWRKEKKYIYLKKNILGSYDVSLGFGPRQWSMSLALAPQAEGLVFESQLFVKTGRNSSTA